MKPACGRQGYRKGSKRRALQAFYWRGTSPQNDEQTGTIRSEDVYGEFCSVSLGA